MYTIDGEILKIKKEIEELKAKMELLDINDPNNRFKYPNMKSELRILYDKLDKLLEEKNNSNTNGITKIKKKNLMFFLFLYGGA